jgi:hypothetical protein
LTKSGSGPATTGGELVADSTGRGDVISVVADDAGVTTGVEL